MDKRLGTILVPVIVEEKLTEVSAGVNVFYFYKKANKDKNKFFNMLSDFRKKHSDTKWMKMLNYALEDFNENPKKYKTIDDKQNKLFKNLQQNKKVYVFHKNFITQIIYKFNMISYTHILNTNTSLCYAFRYEICSCDYVYCVVFCITPTKAYLQSIYLRSR